MSWEGIPDPVGPNRRAGAPIGIIGGKPVLFAGTGSFSADALAFDEPNNDWILQSINVGQGAPPNCDLTDGTAFATANGSLWMAGGHRRDGALNLQLCQLRAASFNAVSVEDMGVQSINVGVDAAMAAIGNQLVVFGGTIDTTDTAAVLRLDVTGPLPLLFATVDVSGGPSPRHGVAMTNDPIDVNSLLLFGGVIDGRPSAEVWRLNDAAGLLPSWQQLNDLPQAVAFAAAVQFDVRDPTGALISAYVYVIAGANTDDATRDVFRFENNTATLQSDVSPPPLISRRTRATAVAIERSNGQPGALVVGGIDTLSEGVCPLGGTL